ncbi:methionine sulfoxide reductase A [Methanomicrobiaceae archaeon CYW5]|uniref:peptide-methionine (S)-S-oxide reductase MsrA n=1 Tax=Methanovulcanius yangii TaxID=1789227 RepID=UPI0029CA2975|nr:peptide-methionine (S)-S-oxide reductase MsrA [Methanovulcanius yangii]MBT8507536.1 methionine sulfoxide reductase A [Methanovulcanius yangii]
MEGTADFAAERRETATFAAGCFWGVEARFAELEGVVSTRVGYTGGTMAHPTYEDVCTGRTGHAEAVEVAFDPTIIGYGELVEIFFSIHDPTTHNRQGPDVGSQYRSVIFYHSDDQRRIAENIRDRLADEDAFGRPIVTAIEPAGRFWEAESYHQKYFTKHGGRRACPF